MINDLLQASSPLLHGYLEGRHPSLRPKHRAILFDWMSEVSVSYKQRQETLCRAWAICDAFLAQSSGMTTARLQLVGVTSLLLASKFEEVSGERDLLVSDALELCAGLYTAPQVTSMEAEILSVLGWRIGMPTPQSFLHRCCTAYACPASNPAQFFTLECMAGFLLELACVEYGSLRFKPSQLAAAAAACAARCVLGPDAGAHTPEVTSVLRSDPWQVYEPLHFVESCALGVGPLVGHGLSAVRSKYSRTRYGAVATRGILTVTSLYYPASAPAAGTAAGGQ